MPDVNGVLAQMRSFTDVRMIMCILGICALSQLSRNPKVVYQSREDYERTTHVRTCVRIMCAFSRFCMCTVLEGSTVLPSLSK